MMGCLAKASWNSALRVFASVGAANAGVAPFAECRFEYFGKDEGMGR